MDSLLSRLRTPGRCAVGEHPGLPARLRLLGRVSRFASHDDGSALVEYALLLALVAGAISIATELVSTGIQQATGNLASGMDGSVSPRATKLATSTYAGHRHAGNVARDHDHESPAGTAWQLPLLAVSLVSGGPIWYALHRRRRPAARTDSPDSLPEQAAPKSDVSRVLEKRNEIMRILSNDLNSLWDGAIQVRHLMSKQIISVAPKTAVEAIKTLMAERDIHHLVVCDENAGLLGMLCDRDLLSGDGRTAEARMTRAPVTVSPDTPIGPAVTLMINRGTSCLPVVAHGVCQGVLTTTDLAIALQCTLQILQKTAADLDSAPETLVDISPVAG